MKFLRTHSIRICADVCISVLVFIAPWWLSFATALFFAFYFKNYYELVWAGILADGIGGNLAHSPPLIVFGALCALIALSFLKRFLVPLPRV
ncbi:MAG: hypothetical protein AAB587_02505 [Patescibacteria group bacterium]